MAGVFGSTSRSGIRPLNAGSGSRDAALTLLASFPDLDRLEADRDKPVAPADTDDSAKTRPRIGWGSIAILAVVAFAACTAAWWIDRGPIDPGTAEIAKARLTEDGGPKPATPIRTATKMKKSARR